MESSAFLQPISFISQVYSPAGKTKSPIHRLPSCPPSVSRRLATAPPSAVKSPRGFGSPPENLRGNQKRTKKKRYPDEDGDDDDLDVASEDVTIPEVVTNRMLKRMGLSVGIPLSLGLLFFPFFYYLKVVQKVDVPTWVPFLISFFFFGSAFLGVSYGIVSSSWDPSREGSLLGWNEAQRNWPVFWQSLRGGRKTNNE